MARIACIQLALVPDASANREACLALIEAAAAVSPDLIVLPEMSNWSGGLVRSLDDALAHGTPIPGDFTAAIARRATLHRCHIAVGMIERTDTEAFISSVIIAPDGAIVLKVQKQILFGGQRLWASVGRCGNPVVSRPFGRVGVYICADGLIPETTRVLAVSGAQLLINTLHSGGHDETWLHIPARAAENRCWVASANKVGARDLGAPGAFCGGSQILSPAGEVIARADDCTAGFVYADIDLKEADDKRMAGEDLMALRRPECYRLLAQAHVAPGGERKGPAALGVAALQPRGLHEQAIEEAIAQWHQAVVQGAGLIITPFLFAHDLARLPAQAAREAAHTSGWLSRLATTARATASWGVVSLLADNQGRFVPSAWLINPHGEPIACQPQVHLPGAWRSWATAGDALQVHDTHAGRIGILSDADALLPESYRVLARQGAELIVIAGRWRTESEIDLLLPERAAENRVNIAWANRTDSALRRGSVLIPVIPYPSEPHWKVRAPDRLEAAPDAPFILHGMNLAATLDKTVGPQGCNLMTSTLPDAYRRLTGV